MKLINLEEACDGMIIAQDIYGSSSQRLVSKGAVVTGALKKSLARYDISRIPVEVAVIEREFTEEEKLEAETKCREIILQRFRYGTENAIMNIIYETLIKIEAMESLSCQSS